MLSGEEEEADWVKTDGDKDRRRECEGCIKVRVTNKALDRGKKTGEMWEWVETQR